SRTPPPLSWTHPPPSPSVSPARPIRCEIRISYLLFPTSHHLRSHSPYLRRRIDDRRARRPQRLLLRRSRSRRADNDRSRMAHPPTRRRRRTGDECDHRLLHLARDVLRRLLPRHPPHLTDKHNGFCAGVLVEHAQRLNL